MPGLPPAQTHVARYKALSPDDPGLASLASPSMGAHGHSTRLGSDLGPDKPGHHRRWPARGKRLAGLHCADVTRVDSVCKCICYTRNAHTRGWHVHAHSGDLHRSRLPVSSALATEDGAGISWLLVETGNGKGRQVRSSRPPKSIRQSAACLFRSQEHPSGTA